MCKSNQQQLETEIQRKNFSRAADLAASLNLEKEAVEDLRKKALWQMAALYRNAIGTKMLADRYGYSEYEVKKILQEHAEKIRRNGSTKPLDVCYDYDTRRYINFEEWMVRHL